MGGGQDAQATVSSPPGVKIIRAGVKIPWEILTPGEQAARGYLDPRGSSCPGVKINRYTSTGPLDYESRDPHRTETLPCVSPGIYMGMLKFAGIFLGYAKFVDFLWG